MARELSILLLAAGLGTRLRPLTLQMPKPLVPVVDETILARQAKLARTVFGARLHINAFYLADKLKTAAESIGFSKVWVESPEILGTGGPLHRMYAEGFRGELLVMNSDCHCRFDLNNFISNARNSGASFALLGVDYPKVNSIGVDAEGRLSRVNKRFDFGTSVIPATFSGISWYSEYALSEIFGEERDVVRFWERKAKAGEAPWVDLSQKDSPWIDMGSPDGLMRACFARLAELRTDRWICPGSPLASDSAFLARSSDFVIQEGARVPATATLKNALLFAGAQVNENEFVTNEIRGLNFNWKLQ
ncbi:MAG: sugar phosphate nucleotidyltransferase [Fibrobacteraceae bacterium]